MKRFTFVLALFVLLPLVMQAQPNTRKVYRDSIAANATAAGHLANETPGYGQYKYLRSDIASYKDKVLFIKFAKITDSVAVWGGVVNFGVDTTWTQLRLKPDELRATTGVWSTAGILPQSARDTSLLWLTPVTTNRHTFTIPMHEYVYPYYRITAAPYDSGKIWIQDIRRGGN